MSKVVKYYYSTPVIKGTITVNPILDKTVVNNIQQERRYTIAVVFDDKDATIKFGLATCQPIDNFCKATGRKIAEKNALENPFHIIYNFSGARNKYADEVMHIMTSTEYKLLKRSCPHLFNSKYFIN